ncbi:hypothetical protein BVC71_07245 [Marivivens niveibacter]|uniref:Tyr recombinase domain-containing protein n=1 Tax=Marivivens niveibacter TaxID=1930667 RepID=A0A251WZ54_9RHOB|nr:tyrosine-type recombinase/integrase [Marivivens niveibacter]OUD09626.1 hypothetical protein BVC71_07245 [Marivivens niveibacter]
MAMTIKLKYIDSLSGGRKRFRRRFPKDIATELGEEFFQVAMEAREGSSLLKEHGLLLAEFEKIVAKARQTEEEKQNASPRVRWKEATETANSLIKGARGFDDETEVRLLVAEHIAQENGDPLLIRALTNPSAEAPELTLKDAKDLYVKERLADDRSSRNRIERICNRVEASLGPLNKIQLIDLNREHARKLRDDMLATPKRNGELLAPESVRRELNMVRAILSLAIVEFDLQGKVQNPFEKLEVTSKKNARPTSAADKRDPLPADILIAMRAKMKENLRVPSLGLIWRLLEGTGCRNAEIIGLRVEDVKLDAPYPHLCIRWHEDRQIKTAASERNVPLVGDALEAAREALEAARGYDMLFPRYAHEGGADAASQSLMKQLRSVTKDKRHVVYSLRHNMKDHLISAGVDERDEHRILGHAMKGVGNRVYGGKQAALKAAYLAMQKAHEQMP